MFLRTRFAAVPFYALRFAGARTIVDYFAVNAFGDDFIPRTFIVSRYAVCVAVPHR